MSDTYSNPAGNTYLADLGITVQPTGVVHSDVWRIHPIMRYIPVASVMRGITGDEIQVMADFSAALSFAENTALTDQAMPSITGYAPTLVGRGFSVSQSVQGRQRVSDDRWPAFEKIRAQKVLRVMIDDLSHGATNSVILLSSGFTDVTDDAAGNASLDGFLTCVFAVSRPSVAFYDVVGIKGIVDGIRAEGHLYANDGVTDQIRRFFAEWTPDQIHSETGFVAEIAGCRIHQTNNKTGDASRLYETGGVTHGIVMADHMRRLQAAKSNPMSQYEDVAPPIVVVGREDPIPDLPAVHQPKDEFVLTSGPAMPNMVLKPGKVTLKSWYDLGNNVAGYKRDYGWDVDAIAPNAADIRCHQYLSTYA